MELDPNRRNGYRAIRVKFKVTLTRVHVLARPRLPDSESSAFAPNKPAGFWWLPFGGRFSLRL